MTVLAVDLVIFEVLVISLICVNPAPEMSIQHDTVLSLLVDVFSTSIFAWELMALLGTVIWRVTPANSTVTPRACVGITANALTGI